MAGLSTGARTYDTRVVSSQAVLPEPPSMWNFSSLKDVETCPLRYVLSRADYPGLWDKHGYPRTPIPGAIKGDVVHGSLEIIVKAMVKAGCRSTRSAEAVSVLRGLGGYTAVAEEVLGRQLARFDGNPRVGEDRRQQLTRALTDWLPEAREQIQTYLNRIELSRAAPPPAPSGATPPDLRPSRHPAGLGDHPEQDLVADNLRLNGRVDLLSVRADGVTITDFKTGTEGVEHHDQLRLYALLWHADSTVNPDALPVSSLVAAYPSHEVAVQVPAANDLAHLTSEITSRVAAADVAVAAVSPKARVGEHCSLCNVRALCDMYWTIGAPKTSDVANGAWYDLQGTVLREHGVKSWVVREAQGSAEVLVRTPSPSVTLPVGQTVRIIGARRTSDPDEEDALIAGLSLGSETFELAD